MHFVNRNSVENPPLVKLKEFHDSDQTTWIAYNAARIAGIKPLPAKPASHWTHNEIRTPLKRLFLINCGYCGIFTDEGHDAEVDHKFPVSLDKDANHIYDWQNYIWSCPACNGNKSNFYPLLDPCSEDEMNSIYFHTADGRYLLYEHASEDCMKKYNLTELKTYMNGKKRPIRRRCVYNDIYDIHLTVLNRLYWIYNLEVANHGDQSQEATSKMNEILIKKESLLDIFRSGDYLYLIKQAFNRFTQREKSYLPFTFEDMLAESGYLD